VESELCPFFWELDTEVGTSFPESGRVDFVEAGERNLYSIRLGYAAETLASLGDVDQSHPLIQAFNAISGILTSADFVEQGMMPEASDFLAPLHQGVLVCKDARFGQEAGQADARQAAANKVAGACRAWNNSLDSTSWSTWSKGSRPETRASAIKAVRQTSRVDDGWTDLANDMATMNRVGQTVFHKGTDKQQRTYIHAMARAKSVCNQALSLAK
jgi:hypothetical protein